MAIIHAPGFTNCTILSAPRYKKMHNFCLKAYISNCIHGACFTILMPRGYIIIVSMMLFPLDVVSMVLFFHWIHDNCFNDVLLLGCCFHDTLIFFFDIVSKMPFSVAMKMV